MNDINGNQLADAFESGLEGITIELRDSGNTLLVCTITTLDGSYLFFGITAGEVTVQESDPDGYLSTTLNNVPVTIAAGGAGQANFYLSLAAPDVRRVAQVISGAGSYDFGEVEIAVTDDASCLTGITVQRHESSHPSTIPGIESDKYWQISPNEGCESGFEVSMTMPADVAAAWCVPCFDYSCRGPTKTN